MHIYLLLNKSGRILIEIDQVNDEDLGVCKSFNRKPLKNGIYSDFGILADLTGISFSLPYLTGKTLLNYKGSEHSIIDMKLINDFQELIKILKKLLVSPNETALTVISPETFRAAAFSPEEKKESRPVFKIKDLFDLIAKSKESLVGEFKDEAAEKQAVDEALTLIESISAYEKHPTINKIQKTQLVQEKVSLSFIVNQLQKSRELVAELLKDLEKQSDPSYYQVPTIEEKIIKIQNARTRLKIVNAQEEKLLTPHKRLVTKTYLNSLTKISMEEHEVRMRLAHKTEDYIKRFQHVPAMLGLEQLLAEANAHLVYFKNHYRDMFNYPLLQEQIQLLRKEIGKYELRLSDFLKPVKAKIETLNTKMIYFKNELARGSDEYDMEYSIFHLKIEINACELTLAEYKESYFQVSKSLRDGIKEADKMLQDYKKFLSEVEIYIETLNFERIQSFHFTLVEDSAEISFIKKLEENINKVGGYLKSVSEFKGSSEYKELNEELDKFQRKAEEYKTSYNRCEKFITKLTLQIQKLNEKSAERYVNGVYANNILKADLFLDEIVDVNLVTSHQSKIKNLSQQFNAIREKIIQEDKTYALKARANLALTTAKLEQRVMSNQLASKEELSEATNMVHAHATIANSLLDGGDFLLAETVALSANIQRLEARYRMHEKEVNKNIVTLEAQRTAIAQNYLRDKKIESKAVEELRALIKIVEKSPLYKEKTPLGDTLRETIYLAQRDVAEFQDLVLMTRKWSSTLFNVRAEKVEKNSGLEKISLEYDKFYKL